VCAIDAGGNAVDPDQPGRRDAQQQALDLQQAAKVLDARVADALGAKPWSRRGVTSPELRKVLQSLPEATSEVGRLLDKRAAAAQPLDEPTASRLRSLLSTEVAGIELDSAWRLLEGLQQLFLALGAFDPVYVRTLLEVEAALDARPAGEAEEPWPYYGWGRVRWGQVFPPGDLEAVLGASAGQPGIREGALPWAIEHLNTLFRSRIENGRKRRTRLALRDRFFLYSLLVLAPLVVLLLALTVTASDDRISWSVGGLAAAAGAVGGTVSGVLKLRDLIRITEFRMLGLGVVVQPFVGAAAALFMLFVLMSGVIELPGVDPSDPSWAGLAVYGFAAGFSEPFWLGVVRRVAGLSDDPQAGVAPSSSEARPG
jgi:hypothetical protein